MTPTHPVPIDTDAVPCRRDPELFFSQRGDAGHPAAVQLRIDEAKAICARCPLKDPCLAYAITFDVEGTWGGSTLKERNRLRKNNGIVPISITTGTARASVYRRTA